MGVCMHTPVDAVLSLHVHTGASVQVCKSLFPMCLCSLGVPGIRTCRCSRHPPVSCSRTQHLPALPPCLLCVPWPPHLPCVPTGSRTEGLHSPSESVFLHMEGIPFIQEEPADNVENSKQQSESGRDTHTRP